MKKVIALNLFIDVVMKHLTLIFTIDFDLMLYHSLTNSQAQYGIIARGRAASCLLTANIGCFKSRH